MAMSGKLVAPVYMAMGAFGQRLGAVGAQDGDGGHHRQRPPRMGDVEHHQQQHAERRSARAAISVTPPWLRPSAEACACRFGDVERLGHHEEDGADGHDRLRQPDPGCRPWSAFSPPRARHHAHAVPGEHSEESRRWPLRGSPARPPGPRAAGPLTRPPKPMWRRRFSAAQGRARNT